MAAPRSSSLRALRVLSQQNTATPYLRRGLHITGSHSAPPTNTSDRSTLYGSYTLADLKNECLKRSLRSAGSKTEVCITPLYEYFPANQVSSSSLTVSPTMTSSNPAHSASP